MRAALFLTLSLILGSSAITGAQPPVLPPPGSAEPAPIQPVPLHPAPLHPVPGQPGIIVIPHQRVSAYAVWDHYAVDRRGAFKPRVVVTPHGDFYSINGKPYPWVSTNSRHVMPYAAD